MNTRALQPLRWRVLIAALASLPAACSLAPTYHVPTTEQVSEYKEAGDWLPAQPADTAPRGEWWQIFADSTLNELEAQLPQSPNLHAAVARFDQARAVAGLASSDLYPRVALDGSAKRARTSANAPGNEGISRIGNDFSASAGLSWEIDLFGRLRNTAAAARDRAEAAGADLGAVELALRAELASNYFSLRGLDATTQLLSDTAQFYDGALERIAHRYEMGVAAATDVDQAKAQLATTRAQLAAARLQRAQFEHAIAVLLGKTPESFTLAAVSTIADPPPIALALPSQLLQRRPDIASAERQVAAANAQIGVARAAWFPVFSFSAAAGYESMQSQSWFKAPSRFWSLGPALSLPLLDAGGRTNLNRQARAIHDEAVANYRHATLNAYREVEDSLAALHYLADVQREQETAAAAATSSAYHADQRYAAGVADYLEVTSTRSAALQAQRAALDARVQRLNASVALVRAFGGAWNNTTTPLQ